MCKGTNEGREKFESHKGFHDRKQISRFDCSTVLKLTEHDERQSPHSLPEDSLREQRLSRTKKTQGPKQKKSGKPSADCMP
jgi:hypothetical protein